MRNIVFEKIVDNKSTRLTIAFPQRVGPEQGLAYVRQHFPGYEKVNVPESNTPQVVCDESQGAPSLIEGVQAANAPAPAPSKVFKDLEDGDSEDEDSEF